MTDEIPGLVGVYVKLHVESTGPRLRIYRHIGRGEWVGP